MELRKSRCIWLLATLLIVGFLFTGLVSYFTAHKSIIAQIAQTPTPLSSDRIYSEIQRNLLQPVIISSMMANDTFMRNWVLTGERNEEHAIQYLKAIQTQYKTVTSFFVSESTRKYYHSTGEIRTVDPLEPQDNWYFRVRKMSTDYEINIDNDTVAINSQTIFLNHRMYDDTGNYIGAIGIGLAMNALQAAMENYGTYYNSQVYFIDEKGMVTLRSSLNKIPESIQQAAELSHYTKQILTAKSNTIEYKIADTQYYVNTRFFPELNWYLIIEQKKKDVALLQNTLILNLASSLFVSILILLLVTASINGYQKSIEVIATTDKLTGVANRQLFDVLVQQTYNQSRRNKSPLGAIMLDIDYFKNINDTYGHPTGDAVLKSLAQLIKHSIRKSDVIFRWGGEEFLILLPESDTQIAAQVAEKIRQKVSEHKIKFSGNSIPITVSAGVTSTAELDNVDDLVAHADNALYIAKGNGRDRVERYYP